MNNVFGALSKAIKAYERDNDPPILGDVRTTIDYPIGTLLRDITKFEVWNGHKWTSDFDELYQVQSVGQ